MNEITNLTPDVTYSAGVVKFENFEEYKLQTQKIADFVSSIVVTEDTIQASKKMIAATRKIVDGLNRRRIDMKKDILASYTNFEGQVKELQGIIDDADRIVREQVNELENQRRAEKKDEIKAVWDKRRVMYDIPIPDLFNHWFDERYLNNGVSMSKIESSMTDFLEDVQIDMTLIQPLDRAHEVFREYIKTCDLTLAMAAVKQLDREQEAAEKALHTVREGVSDLVATFVVHGEKDIKLAEMLLKENHIEYTRK
ncbi:DUF1351 domain-containing protein [Faecalibaculum rodentium]|uniref:DUF1351 domain-containing protein n=1 Tax=Faecalibaculum rodentium TaxID=1702221 RepID=UPI0023EF6513|nr:DUF1351 domain-containing protein [Faecalibaculum rodentium]